MDRYVGIGEYCISKNRGDVIKTFALASCVAVAVYDPGVYTAGLAHIALPSAGISLMDNDTKPCYYATIGVPLLINRMISEYGCLKSRLIVELFGGAKSTNNQDIFNIGRKNIQAIKLILDSMELKYINRETGNIYSRTLELDIASGKITIIRQPIII